MTLISDLVTAWSWLKTKFIDHIQSGDKVAIVITQTIKTLLTNPIAGFLENIADTVTNSQLPTAIVNTLIGIIPKILAVELGIQGLPDNATPAQISAFEQSVMAAFSVTSNNSKVYTTLAAQIYGIIQASIANGKTNFADLVADVEQAYADYQADITNTASTDIGIVNAPAGTVLSNGNEVLPN